ncbi:hypothetical protein M422DRAFT_53438 [Sphaerobolus stellatus SS14]|uniref:Uncharacterized protein n=1 Tax=Sphaerobolus stellatus (strain SS14) TaxID=990650 RepID=A0A0C9U9M7_SPHS4|nr:hypothetical protein M422DRAFT_53438 [Sphaerobolus stellatus SS14]
MPEEITLDSELSNQIDKIREEWPFWDRLRPIWRDLPNYNPVGVTLSASGGNHAEAAADLFQHRSEMVELQSDDAGSGIEGTEFDEQEDSTTGRAQSSGKSTGGCSVEPASPMQICMSPRLAEKKIHQIPTLLLPQRFTSSPTPASLKLGKLTSKLSVKRPAAEAFSSDIELAETERLKERQAQLSREKLTKLELKKLQLEFEHQSKQHQEQMEHEKAQWRFQLELAKLNMGKAGGDVGSNTMFTLPGGSGNDLDNVGSYSLNLNGLDWNNSNL